MRTVFNRYILSSAFLTLFLLLPIIALFVYSFGGSSDTLQHLKETVLTDYVINTLKLVLFVSILSLVFGVVSAYLTVFYQLRFAYLFSILLALPFVIPTYILGYIYSDLLGLFGPVHLFLKEIGLVDKQYFNVLQFNSVAVILSLGLYPYIYLIVKSSFLKSSTALLYPALSLGKSRLELFYQAILPLSRPAIIGSLSLVIMEVVNEYGAVSYYGVDTLSTAIYSAWFGLNDPKSSAFLSIIAMSIIFVLMAVEKFSRGNSSYRTESLSKEIKKQELRGVKKVLAYLFLSIPIVFGFLVPFIWIIIYSFKYAVDVIDEEFYEVIFNSFIASSFSAVVIVFLALFISYSVRIYSNNATKYLTKVAGIGYAIPGVVIGVGVLSLFGDIDHFLIETFTLDELLISGTLFAIVFGYVVRFLAVGVNMTDSSYEKISISINRASRNLGLGYWKTLLKVEFPLMRKTLLFAFLLVFVDVVKELPLTLVLRPFNYETLSTKTYEYATNTMIQESSIYALVIVILCFIPIIISNHNTKEV
jgi:iron(III) transport system permease protein